MLQKQVYRTVVRICAASRGLQCPPDVQMSHSRERQTPCHTRSREATFALRVPHTEPREQSQKTWRAAPGRSGGGGTSCTILNSPASSSSASTDMPSTATFAKRPAQPKYRVTAQQPRGVNPHSAAKRCVPWAAGRRSRNRMQATPPCSNRPSRPLSVLTRRTVMAGLSGVSRDATRRPSATEGPVQLRRRRSALTVTVGIPTGIHASDGSCTK